MTSLEFELVYPQLTLGAIMRTRGRRRFAFFWEELLVRESIGDNWGLSQGEVELYFPGAGDIRSWSLLQSRTGKSSLWRTLRV